MGRGKLSMQLIANEKSRKTTFLKRKKSLMRKAYELSMLCDVRMCLLIHGPKLDDQSSGELYTWPPSRNDIGDIINAYKASSLHKRASKVSGLCDFFYDRYKKLQAEISKIRKHTAEIKFPKCDDHLKFLSEDQLRFLVFDLDSKIDVAKRKIDFIEGSSSRNFYANFKRETDFEERNSLLNNQIAIATEEVPHSLNFAGNSIPMVPMNQGVDLSQVLYNHGHFQSSVYSHSVANVTMDQNNAMELSNLNYSICQYSTGMQSISPLSYMEFADPVFYNDNSQILFDNNASGQVSDPFDYPNYEYLMKMNN